MSFKITIDQEWNKSDLELEIMNININFILNSIDPSLFKSSEMIGKLFNNLIISSVFSEVGP